MGAGMPRHTFQQLCCVYEFSCLFVIFVFQSKIRIQFQRLVNSHAQLVRYHLRRLIDLGIRDVQSSSHIPYNSPGCHGSECNDLCHLVLTVFVYDIIDDFRPALIAEIDVDIGHRHSFRIEEPFKKQIVSDGIYAGYTKCVCHKTACGRASARSDTYAVFPCIPDKIPDDEEVIHISHLPDDLQFIFKPLTVFRY